MSEPITSAIPVRNYESLFDRGIAESFYGVEPEPNGRYYDDDRGLFVKTTVAGGPYTHDLVQFAPDALAFTSAGLAPKIGHENQVIGDDDWIHFSLRLGCGSWEDVSNYGMLKQATKTCLIARYPGQSKIERIADGADSWRVACLWLKPKAFLRLLELSEARIPPELSWLAKDKCDATTHTTINLTPRMYLAVNDVLACQLTGGVRRAFVFAKYLELVATIYQTMVEQVGKEQQLTIRLTAKDAERIAEAAQIVTQKLDQMDSLSDLAKKVGINRTKLVLGFRAVYGTSVEAYWRDRRLQKAHGLLSEEGLSVNEVAFRVGYSEISSFTRAFTRKFGVVPKSCRSF